MTSCHSLPIDETIEIICDNLFSNALRYHGKTRHELENFLALQLKTVTSYLTVCYISYINRLMASRWEVH